MMWIWIRIVAAILMMAPLGARAADLVVWRVEGYYAEEAEAVREIVAASCEPCRFPHPREQAGTVHDRGHGRLSDDVVIPEPFRPVLLGEVRVVGGDDVVGTQALKRAEHHVDERCRGRVAVGDLDCGRSRPVQGVVDVHE